MPVMYALKETMIDTMSEQPGYLMDIPLVVSPETPIDMAKLKTEPSIGCIESIWQQTSISACVGDQSLSSGGFLYTPHVVAWNYGPDCYAPMAEGEFPPFATISILLKDLQPFVRGILEKEDYVSDPEYHAIRNAIWSILCIACHYNHISVNPPNFRPEQIVSILTIGVLATHPTLWFHEDRLTRNPPLGEDRVGLPLFRVV